MRMIQNKFETIYNKFILGWQQADKRKRIRMYICVYTVAFLIAFLIAYMPFFLRGCGFVWNEEGRLQHFPILIYVGKMLRHTFTNLLGGTLAIPLFDISIGSGDDIISFLNSQGGTDPLLLLSAFVPMKYSEYLYAFIAIFRVYLAGLSFSYLCFYFNKRAAHTLIGSMVYCFSGYAVFLSVRHPYFITPMVLLPLLVVGIDKILKKDKPYLFILTMFYTVLCGYYHLYMMTIMLLIYATVRFFDLYKVSRVKEFFLALGRGIGGYALGLGLGAIIFFPAAMGFLNSARSTNHIYNFYSWHHQIAMALRLIAAPASWDFMALAAVVVIAIVLLFTSKQHRTLKLLTYAAFAFLLTSGGGMIMNGFQYPTNRWAFGFVLVTSYVVVEMLPKMAEMSRKQQMLFIYIDIVYIAICFLTKFGRVLLFVGAFFLTFTLLVFIVVLQRYKGCPETEREDTSKRYAHIYREAICLTLIIFNVTVNAIYLFANDQGGYVREFEKFGHEIVMMQNDPICELEPFLQKNKNGRGDGRGFSLNRSMVWQVPDIHLHNSVANKYIVEFWNRLENCGSREAFCVKYTDNKTIVNTLLSCLYHVESARAPMEYVPYGYRMIIEDTKRGNSVYKNDYALPWGYTYDNTISYADIDGLNGIEKQEVMLQAIALGEDKIVNSDLSDINFDAKRLPYTVYYDGCKWKDGKFTVNRPNAVIILDFSMPAEMEGYVRLNNFDLDGSGSYDFTITMRCENILKDSWLHSNLFIHPNGRKNIPFNLGCSDKVRRSATITFPRPGTFKLKDIELYALPMTNYPARVNALRAEPLKNIKWGTNELTGTVDLTKDKILCVSVPYSKGWSATVDGKEEKILRGNYMFMALPLKAGHHDIVFSYCPPGLKIGAVLTLLSWGILAAMLIRERRRKREERTA